MTKCLDLEVSLVDIQPRIWRRFLIDAKASFLDLHEAIQESGPWENCHLFAFQTRKNKPIAGLPDDESGESDPDAREVSLASFFKRPGDLCLYWYDFGDNWWHEVLLHGFVDSPGKVFRSLIGGARAFPPEDCGGQGGYEECVAVATGRLKNPDRREWLGNWKPESFKVGAFKRAFDLKNRRKRYLADYGF
jgi:pRiA4b ORF-3-like protein